MFCLKLARMIPMTFSWAITKPNPIPPYDLIYNTPIFNMICYPRSENRENLSKMDLNEYLCLCIETDHSTKIFLEKMHNFIKWQKIRKTPFLENLLETSEDVVNYLYEEFKIQEKTINFLNGEIPADPSGEDNPLSKFFIKNDTVPLENLYTMYSKYLIDHLIEKYAYEFKQLSVLNIPGLLKMELEFVDCHSNYSYEDRDFKTVLDAVRQINRQVIGMFVSTIKMAS